MRPAILLYLFVCVCWALRCAKQNKSEGARNYDAHSPRATHRMHSHSRRIPHEIETMSNKNAFRRSESIEIEEHEFLEKFIEANQFSFVYNIRMCVRSLS